MLKTNEIYLGDCLEVMRDIDDKSIDMVLCDLPYGTTRNRWDSIIPLDELWNQYNRIIKDKGVIILNSDSVFTAKLILSNERWYKYTMIWDKQRGCDFLNANRKPLKSHEELLIFYKNQPTFNKQYWYSKPYKKITSITQSSNYGFNYAKKKAHIESKDGKRNPLTIISIAKDAKRLHPTQKPVALCEYLIKTYTNEGEVVLDNCMGSGTTIIACINTNRNYIGIELDAGYFNIAKKRIENSL